MISAFADSFKIPELRSRILFTLAMIVIVRIGMNITLPGVDTAVLDQWIASRATDTGAAGQVAALLNVFSGGGLANCAIFALGIMPYISASIMLQLLTAVYPPLSKMAREEGGRQKITQYTRLATIALCLFQGYLLAKSLAQPGQNIFLGGLQEVIDSTGKPLVPDFGWAFIVVTVITITAGTMLMMWLGEMITERGIGNGVSILIAVNIVSDLPGAMVQVWQTYVGGASAAEASKPATLVLLVAFMIIVIAGVIAITQATRRIAIQYAKRVVGRKVYGGQTQYLPLKVNYSGVMPIIFAQAILLFPAQIIGALFPDVGWIIRLTETISAGWVYYTLSAALIFFFSYFWVATMFQPTQISEDLKKSGGYLPGIRPGKPTADFLDFTMSRLTFAGAIFLTGLYVMPAIITKVLGISPTAAQFFGGTSLLILVGVVLDVMRQIETYLLQSHYDGFLKKGRIRGRFDRMTQTGQGADSKTVVWLWTGIAIIAIAGVAYFIATGK